MAKYPNFLTECWFYLLLEKPHPAWLPFERLEDPKETEDNEVEKDEDEYSIESENDNKDSDEWSLKDLWSDETYNIDLLLDEEDDIDDGKRFTFELQ